MLTYIGNDFIPGIPARDLTDAEVEQFGGDEFAEAMIATGLYAAPKVAAPTATEDKIQRRPKRVVAGGTEDK